MVQPRNNHKYVLRRRCEICRYRARLGMVTHYVPNPAQIEAGAREVRAGWSEDQRHEHWNVKGDEAPMPGCPINCPHARRRWDISGMTDTRRIDSSVTKTFLAPDWDAARALFYEQYPNGRISVCTEDKENSPVLTPDEVSGLRRLLKRVADSERT
jgi:hypothetical protein